MLIQSNVKFDLHNLTDLNRCRISTLSLMALRITRYKGYWGLNLGLYVL